VAETDWGSMIIQLFWIMFFILILTGANQRIQMKLWSIDIRNKLRVIKKYIDDDQQRIESYLRNLGVKTPSLLVRRINNYFIIEPVTIEPTDIIKRLEHLIRTSDENVKNIVSEYLPEGVNRYEKSLVETGLLILAELNQIYKIIQHYLLVSERENNWILLMQLQLIMPQVLRIVNIYHNAFESFLSGKPIGDAIGPYIAYRLIESGQIVSSRVIDETRITEVFLDDRRIFIVKAEGPGSNVGRPGSVLAKLIEELNGNVDLVITIDAALKLEGEVNGEIAEGVGAAIGDPGPEKIAIERATSKYDIPLHAVIVKIGLEEAITTMRKEIYEACERAYEYVRRMINRLTKPYSTIIVAGIGNTLGVP